VKNKVIDKTVIKKQLTGSYSCFCDMIEFVLIVHPVPVDALKNKVQRSVGPSRRSASKINSGAKHAGSSKKKPEGLFLFACGAIHIGSNDHLASFVKGTRRGLEKWP